MELPERSPEAEDAFVAELRDLDDPEPVANAVELAMTQGRPQLAARLVGLVDELVEIEPGSALDRARKAARLLLLDDGSQDLGELENAWRDAHARRSWRMRRRMRQGVTGTSERISRWDSRRRRR